MAEYPYGYCASGRYHLCITLECGITNTSLLITEVTSETTAQGGLWMEVLMV